MKKILLFIVISLFVNSEYANAQRWAKDVKGESPNFFEIQKAFTDHWKPYNVKNGKYLENGIEKKAPGWKQFKRWEWYWEQRVGPTGHFPENTVIWDEWQKQVGASSLKTSENDNKVAAAWAPIGPYDETVHGLGRVNCIAFHPTDPNTMWIGTPAGGIWKTTTGGTSWTPLADDLPVLGVSSIVVHPTNPNIMYIATGDGERAISLQAFGAQSAGDTKSVGVLKTVDGGATWTTVLSAQQMDGVLIPKLLINPSSPDMVYAASTLGIYKTLDAGVNWNNIQSGDFQDMELKPGDPNTIYASTFDEAGDAQVFVTTDGMNFTQTSSFSGIGRINIEVTPDNADAVDLLCANSSNSGLHGLYYSVTSGATWTQYWDGSVAGQNMLGWHDDGSDQDGQGTYDLAYAIDPNDWNTILLGGINTWKTSDAGANWGISNIWTSGAPYNTNGSTEIVHADKHALVFHPLLTNTLYECNDGGVNKSTDGGTTWTNITNGIQISQFYSISSSQMTADLMSGGRQDNGSLALESGLEYALSGGDGMMTHIDYSDDNFIYTSYINGEIYRYDLNNMPEVTISNNLPGAPLKGEWMTPYLIDPSTPTTVYAGYDEIFKSIDRGDSWTQISNWSFGQNVNYLTVAPSNSNFIYAGWFDGIMITSNGGGSWSDITGSLPVGNQNISSILIDPTDENSVLVTFSGYTATEKVFLTWDAGASWSNITLTGLPNLPVNCSESDENTGDIFLGTDLGVYYLDTATASWAQYGTALPNVVVTDLDIQVSSSKLRAGTFGRGIWETALNTPTVSSPVASFTSNVTSICTSECVNFADNSTNTPTSWSWSFPGGTPATSTLQNPTSICYASAGTYSVTLTATNSGGSDTQTMTNLITVAVCTTPPVASFSSSTTSICMNGCVSYTDNSINIPTSWNWSFPGGNPSSSTQQNPSMICYATPGTYSVTLSATNAYGTDIETMTNLITVNNCTGISESLAGSGISIYPNPFSEATSISYELLGKALINIGVYGLDGRLIQNLVNEEQAAGKHEYSFSAKKLGYSSGVYLLKFRVEGQESTYRLVELE